MGHLLYSVGRSLGGVTTEGKPAPETLTDRLNFDLLFGKAKAVPDISLSVFPLLVIITRGCVSLTLDPPVRVEPHDRMAFIVSNVF